MSFTSAWGGCRPTSAWTPSIGLGRLTGLATVDAALQGDAAVLISALRHLLLPVLTLALARVAIVARMTRAGMLEVLGADYVRTARAKELHERAVIYGHALRNAALPGADNARHTGRLPAGRSNPGRGHLPVAGNGPLRRLFDHQCGFPAVMGVTLTAAALFVLINLLVDLAYVMIDPALSTSVVLRSPRLRGNELAYAGGLLVGMVVVVSALAPLLTAYDPESSVSRSV